MTDARSVCGSRHGRDARVTGGVLVTRASRSASGGVVVTRASRSASGDVLVTRASRPCVTV
jgi:hypothetical protein